MAPTPIYRGCDMSFTCTGAMGGGSPLNAASVTYILKDATGTTVAGGTGTLSYVAASSGNYAGTIESTVTTLVIVDRPYQLVVTLVEGSFNDSRTIDLIAANRGLT